MGPQRITTNIWRIAGSDLTDARDCAVYLINAGEPVLVDCGSGHGFSNLLANIRKAGFRPDDVKTLIMTHCHADHIGAAGLLRSHFGTKLVMHEKDADILERGDIRLTAAFCFDVNLKPTRIDKRLAGDAGDLEFTGALVQWVHTPGHTPGSISLYMEENGEKILFAQDIGAPLLSEFDCDPEAWLHSIQKLFALEADILCDGHSGAYGPKHVVREYLEYCLAAQYKNGYLDAVKK